MIETARKMDDSQAFFLRMKIGIIEKFSNTRKKLNVRDNLEIDNSLLSHLPHNYTVTMKGKPIIIYKYLPLRFQPYLKLF